MDLVEDGQLHPNWRALATVNYPVKRFVRGFGLQTQAERKIESSTIPQSDTDGVNIQKFYEDLTKEYKTNQDTIVSPSFICNLPTTTQKPLLKFDRNTFFRFATMNNTTELARFDYLANDINVRDEFGWTGLMMAACEGAIDAVKLLLQLGADKSTKDKTGRTAMDLAQLKGYHNVANVLQTESKVANANADTPTVTPHASFYCNICNHVFTDTTSREHLTSTVHQFNTKSNNTKNKLNKFNITTRNRGLQLMVKQGWDRESGLGPTSSGRLYPIKTVIRKNRSGLGTDQEPARVTHFGAFDLRAVENNKFNSLQKHKTRSRNDIRREKVREWKREKRLRKELS